jgi:uncharacterized RDD family membrane protein YckC
VSLDTLYHVETPEGIALSLRPAGTVARTLAYAIDLLIRGAITAVAAPLLGMMGGVGAAVGLILYFFLEWFYPVVFELGKHGATPGKRALGLQVVLDSGLPVTPAASVLRNLLRAVDFMPFLYGFGLLSMLLRKDFKRLGDLAAGTLVVYSKPISLHGDIPPGPAWAPQRPVTAREQAAIVSWAGRSKRLTAARLDELAEIATPITLDANDRAHHLGRGRDATQRLMGVAQWLLGNRSDAT